MTTGIVTVCLGIVYSLKPTNPLAYEMVANSAAIGSAATAFVFLALTWQMYERDDAQRGPWGFLVAGVGLYLLGESTWMVLDTALGQEIPFPSVADLFWVLGYVPLFLGLALLIRLMAKGRRIPFPRMAFVIVTSLAILILSTGFVFLPVVQDDRMSIVEKTLNVLYPSLDVVLIILAFVLAANFRRGLLARTWRLMVFGFILIGTSDLTFSWLTWNEAFHDWHPVDLGWVVGYLLLALAAVWQGDVLEGRVSAR